MSSTSRRSRSVVIALAAAAGVVLSSAAGCNAILANDPGTLVVEDEAGTFPEPDATPGPTPLPQPNPPDDGSSAPFDAGSLVLPDDAGITCGGGQKLCNGVCVAATDPTYGCSAAACTPCAIPHGTPSCVGGACAVATCDQGFADCNANPADGCEVDLSKPTSCGSCTTACPPATPTCAPVGTTFQCGTGCTPAAPTRCGNECVDLLTSTNHCGACGAACAPVMNATVSCVAGACTFTCRPDFRACGGRCTALTDPAACGPACVVCPPVANGRPTCAADACGAVCNAGFADCDANPANGCEAALATDPLHCGACGKACPSGVCKAGACQPSPDGG